jgi:XTP/dITP diphosphohydrolase
MNNSITHLTIATFNQGKLQEYRAMIKGIAIELRSLSEFPQVAEVDETAETFAGNAALKASEYATATGSFTLADDSGLEIAALGGRPGVFSARYGGDDLSFAEKIAFILAELRECGDSDRTARFVCETAIADAEGKILITARGECRGAIAAAPHGHGGFGYDPIFVPAGLEMTFGELAAADKHRISHRALAFAQIIPFLRDNMNV